jgi:serine protease Do
MIRALAIAATVTLAAGAPASQEERAGAIARPAVVSVAVEWQGWVRDPTTGEVFGGPTGYQVTSRCSGVVVAQDGFVVTAGHCVDAGPAGGGGALVDRALAELTKYGRVGEPGKARAQLTAAAVVEGATPGTPVRRDVRVELAAGTSAAPEVDLAPATVVDLLPPGHGDVAVLRIPRERLATARIATEDALPAGTPVVAIGYPAQADERLDPGTDPRNDNGQISTRRTVSGSPYYEISAATGQGMGGGPVVDMSGRVIGLLGLASNGEPGQATLVTASSSIRKALRGHDVQTAPSPNDRNFAAGLDRYYDGDYPGSVEFFDAVLAATPSHRQAEEYRRLAVERGAGGPDVLLLLIVGCAALSVCTATAGAILLRSRGRTAAGPPNPPPRSHDV